LQVTDAASLSAEVDRVCALLSPVSASPWVVRVRSLKRVSTLCRSDSFASVRALPSFVPQMARLRSALTAQLGDRRSQVAKQACATVSALSAHFKAAYLLAPTGTEETAQDAHVLEARNTWMELTLNFIDALLPLIPITVQVIKASACLCLSAIVKNIAPLSCGDSERSYASELIQHLAKVGVSHKHGVVRDHSFRALANCIIRIDKTDLARENERDAHESARIQAKLDAAAAAASAAASSTDAAAPPAASSSSSSAASAAASSDSTSSSSSSSSDQSALFAKLESVIAAGIADSFDKARAAARLCLIHLRTVSPARAARIYASLTPSQQKVFDKQLADFLVNRSLSAIGGDAAATAAAASSSKQRSSTPLHQIADEPEHNRSDDEMEAELNPPPAKGHSVVADKAPAAKKKTAAAASAAASVLASSSDIRAARKKAAQAKKGKNKKHSGGGGGGSNGGSASSSASSSAAVSEAEDEQDDVVILTSKVKAASLNGSANGANGINGKEQTTAGEHKEQTPTTMNASDADKSTASSPSKAVVAANDAAPVHLARNVLLLSKLLDLESPCLTEKMIVSHTHTQLSITHAFFCSSLLGCLLAVATFFLPRARTLMSRMNGCRPSRSIRMHVART
jgi:hypothetical protein